jgi:hypothetical protein
MKAARRSGGAHDQRNDIARRRDGLRNSRRRYAQRSPTPAPEPLRGGIDAGEPSASSPAISARPEHLSTGHPGALRCSTAERLLPPVDRCVGPSSPLAARLHSAGRRALRRSCHAGGNPRCARHCIDVRWPVRSAWRRGYVPARSGFGCAPRARERLCRSRRRAEVDAVIRKARGTGIECAQWKAGSIEAIFATALDGAATQGFLLPRPLAQYAEDQRRLARPPEVR